MPNLLSRRAFDLFLGARRKPLESLPGPRPGIFGSVGDFLGGTPPWHVCARYGREYGGVTLIWLPGGPALVLNDPGLIEQVLGSRRYEFEKGSLAEQQFTPAITTHSLVVARLNGNWGALRRADPLEQPWSADWVAAQVEPMRAVTSDMLDAYVGKGTTDLTPVLRRLTFDASSVAVVGQKVPDAVFDDFMLLSETTQERLDTNLPLALVSLSRDFEAARERFYRHFIDRVRAARQRPEPNGVDLLSRTLREMPAIDDERLAYNLALFLFGGTFSASTALVGAFHQLQKYPEAERRLAAEAASLGSGRWTRERLDGAHWVEAVILESLRILPPVRILIRTPVADVQFAGVTLPRGTKIIISNQYLHHDPEHWTHPDTFEPARWLDGGKERDPLHSGHFFPFGRGPRACVAAPFAMMFMRTALAAIAARAKVHVDSTEPFGEELLFGVIRPKGVTGRFVRR
ncbi:cytochrome P450 [Archangium violaceum]|uniref:cytochrome P450 n=1 Tax=Archangium violaceum TaxID=83451 RepID=UPI0005B931BF|nr:cytochrome P450 [Archangium violaceum]